MSTLIPKTFKVEPKAWANFVKAAKLHGTTPAGLLRELMTHVDAAIDGVQSGRIRSSGGSVANLIRTEFPQLSPLQLEAMASILTEASKIEVDSTAKEEPTRSVKLNPEVRSRSRSK